MTTSPVKLFTSAHDLAGCFVQAFVSLSRSSQGKAVITVHCRVKAMKMNSEARLLVLKTK